MVGQLSPHARQVITGILMLSLVVAAGCSMLVSDNSSAEEPLSTASNTISANGTDLRNIDVPDNSSITADGEIDRDDPVLPSTGSHYEPVQFTASAGTTLNVTVTSERGTSNLQLRTPNGTIVAVDSGNGSRAEFKMVEFNQTGQYTLIVAASNESSGFEYTLRVERYIEPDFNGPPSSWDEESRYLEFANDYGFLAENGSRGNLTAINRTANTIEDYIVFTYEINPNATSYERISIDNSLQITYWYLYDEYVSSDDNPTNESWVPDRIYHRAITPEGDFYRSTYVTLGWAQDYGETGDPQLFQARYWETLRYGPAHQEYAEGGNRSTTASEFPEDTYRNVSVNITDD